MKAVQIDNLEKIYATKTHALRDVSIAVEEGDFFALLGPNGAGKTTLIGILCGLVNPSAGRVQVFDAQLGQDTHRARSYLGVVPQEFNFNIFEQVQQIIVNQAGYYGIPYREAKNRSEQYLRELGLWDKRNSQARHLSGGMKRRLMIARALIHRPRILILDEPTAGVDIELRRSMWEYLIKLNQAGTTIILTTHYLEEAEQLCRNIAIIDQGRVIRDGRMQDFLSLLDIETFVLDLADDQLDAAPTLEGYTFRMPNRGQLEVDMHKSQSINDLMAALARQNIQVTSMRNRANRLEELFINLVESRKQV